MNRRRYPKHRVSKDECQMYHAMGRAYNRLNLELDEGKYKRLVSAIREERSSDDIEVNFVENQSNRLSMYNVRLSGADTGPFNVIYDRMRDTVVTFLYPEEAQNIYHFYDIFGNKVSVKHEFGHIWKMTEGELHVPGEVVNKLGEDFWMVSLNGSDRLFRIVENELTEVQK